MEMKGLCDWDSNYLLKHLTTTPKHKHYVLLFLYGFSSYPEQNYLVHTPTVAMAGLQQKYNVNCS